MSKHLVEKLHLVDLNILDAADLVQATMKVVDQIRGNDQTMTDVIEASCHFANQLGIDPERQFSCHHRQRRVPRRLDDRPDTGVRVTLHAFYGQQFKEVLDVHISGMREHLLQFEDPIKPLFSCLQPPIDASEAPSIAALFPPSHAPDPSAQIALMVELRVLAELCPQDELSEVIAASEANKDALGLANRAIRLMLTAPVTFASNERTFSRLKFVKNVLRTSMTDTRLCGLMLLACEKDLGDQIDIGKVVKKWSLLKKRRVRLQ